MKKYEFEFWAFCMCSQSARQPELINMQTNDDGHTFELPTPQNGSNGSKHVWECNEPEISVLGVEDKQMPEMPNLESVFANSLRSVRKKSLFFLASGHTDSCFPNSLTTVWFNAILPTITKHDIEEHLALKWQNNLETEKQLDKTCFINVLYFTDSLFYT